MGKNNSLYLLATIVLATVALAGCTGGDGSDLKPSARATTAQAQLSDDGAQIFEDQKTLVAKSLTPTIVLKQFSGTGPSAVGVGSFPEGYKQLGATVACTGSGDWEATFLQQDSGWGKSGCSLDVGNSITYPVDDPSEEQILDVKVDAGTQFWVTIFATN